MNDKGCMTIRSCIALIILTTMIFGVHHAYADIVKLKRGISFEGRILEENDDEYVVELSVGVVSFKKSEVETIEYFTDLANDQLSKEWEPVNSDEPEDQHVSRSDESVLNDDANPMLPVQAPQSNQDEMVRYKGRYITPEVYEIIQREKDIQDRRYKFLQEKKRKMVQQAEKKKLFVGREKPEAPSQIKPVSEESKKTETFGARRSGLYGEKNNPTSGMYDDSRFKSFNDTGAQYGSFADQNTL